MKNLKPFNLERALVGDTVLTRDRRKVINLRKCKIGNNIQPIIGHIENDGREGDLTGWDLDGKYRNNYESSLDLFMIPKKITYWANIYRNHEEIGNLHVISQLYNSKELAEEAGKVLNNKRYIKTISFDIEE